MPDILEPRLARLRRAIAAVCVLPALLALVGAGRRLLPPEAPAPRPLALVPLRHESSGAAVALARLGAQNVALVADTDESAVLTFDLDKHTLVGRAPLAGAPGQLFLTRAGRVLATFGARDEVGVYEAGEQPGNLRRVATLATAPEPEGMALTGDESTLVVVSGWGRRLEAFSLRTWEKTLSVELPREPRAVVLDDEGAHAFVAHAVGSRISVVDLHHGTVGGVDVSTHEGVVTTARRPLGNGNVTSSGQGLGDGLGLIGLAAMLGDSLGGMESTPARPPARHDRVGAQGFALARVHVGGRERLLLPEAMVDPGHVETVSQLPVGYGVSTPLGFGPEVAYVAVVDPEAQAPFDGSLTVHVNDETCLLPRAAVADDATQSLFVSCLGTDQVVEYDAATVRPVEALRARWSVPSGPTGLALDDHAHVVVWSSFDRILTIIDRAVPDAFTLVSATERRPPTPFEVGRKLFHGSGNPSISPDGRACASCHPDGRDDGLVWSSPDGPRQTPMLAGRLASTAPYGWSGASRSVEEHLHLTMARLGGRGLDRMQMYALLSYLEAMPAPRRPPVHDPDKVARGAEVFLSYEAGCSGCHVPPARSVFTDGELHDVGSTTKSDRLAELETPSLLFVGGTAPYFHDGRYATLRELLVGTDGRMGGHLEEGQIDDLVAYLESL